MTIHPSIHPSVYFFFFPSFLPAQLTFTKSPSLGQPLPGTEGAEVRPAKGLLTQGDADMEAGQQSVGIQVL